MTNYASRQVTYPLFRCRILASALVTKIKMINGRLREVLGGTVLLQGQTLENLDEELIDLIGKRSLLILDLMNMYEKIDERETKLGVKDLKKKIRVLDHLLEEDSHTISLISETTPVSTDFQETWDGGPMRVNQFSSTRIKKLMQAVNREAKDVICRMNEKVEKRSYESVTFPLSEVGIRELGLDKG